MIRMSEELGEIYACDLRYTGDTQLNIWKKPPARGIPLAEELCIWDDDSYIYDPDNIVKRSLQLLNDEYVQYETCGYEPITQMVKRLMKKCNENKYNKPYVILIDSDQMPTRDLGYEGARIRVIVNVTDKNNWDAGRARRYCHREICKKNADDYISRYGHEVALSIMTSRGSC